MHEGHALPSVPTSLPTCGNSASGEEKEATWQAGPGQSLLLVCILRTAQSLSTKNKMAAGGHMAILLSTSGSQIRASKRKFPVILTWLRQRHDQEPELLCGPGP